MKIAAGLITLLLSGGAWAAQSPDIFTTNNYPGRTVWITVYDITKTRQLGAGCINPGGTKRWSSGILFGSFYYVRGEVVDGADCAAGAPHVCDTTVQVNPQINPQGDPLHMGNNTPRNTGWSIRKNGNNCNWEKSTNLDVSNGFPWKPPTPCTGQFFGGARGMLPMPGSYTQSCRNCQYISGGGFGPSDMLIGECERNRGEYLDTQLGDVSKCKKGTIWNDKGVLKCEK